MTDVRDLRDHDLHRLLPAVYRNLSGAGVDDPDLALLKGLSRRAFYANRLLLYRTLPAIELLREHVVEPVVVKGLAVALLYAGGLVMRPMADIDVVVPMAAAGEAIDVLRANDWVPKRQGAPDVWLRRKRGVGLVSSTGGELDLHWRLRFDTPMPGHPPVDELAGLGLVDLPLPEGPTLRALGPTDHLLFVIQHGVRVNSGAQVRWASDAATILRAAGDDVDWEHLVRRAVDERCLLQLRNALEYLVAVLDADVPDEVLEHARRAPIHRRERAAFGVTSGARLPPSAWRTWTAASVDWPRVRMVIGFPSFFRDTWGLGSVAQVPFAAVGRVGRRLRRRGVVARADG